MFYGLYTIVLSFHVLRIHCEMKINVQFLNVFILFGIFEKHSYKIDIL